MLWINVGVRKAIKEEEFRALRISMHLISRDDESLMTDDAA